MITPDLQPHDWVVYEHYGDKRVGQLSRIGDGNIVFLTDGRWLHRESVKPLNWPCSDCPMESRPKFLALPTKSVPDYDAVAAHVAEHGVMFLVASIEWNAAHVALHHRGLGMRKVEDATRQHIGWRVAPVVKHDGRSKKTTPNRKDLS